MLTTALAASVLAAPLTLADPGARLRVHDRVDQARLMAELAELPTMRSPWRSQEHIDGLRATEQLIQDKLIAMGYQPELHEVAFTGGGRAQENTWHNIIINIPGQVEPAEVLIIGAHFDAVPGAPGADDNGTGTVALLELARILKDVPMERTVRLIFFNLEEVGLVGSTQYAGDFGHLWQAGAGSEEGAQPRETIIGMASLDMLGYFSDEPDSQTWPPLPIRLPLPTVADFIAVGGIMQHQSFSRPFIAAMQEGAGDGVKVFAGDLLPIAVPDFLRSDHAPFLSMGIPAILISDTANFRSQHYHRPTDSIDTIDAPRFAAVVRGLANAIHVTAGPMPQNGLPPTPASSPRREPASPRPAPEPVPSDDPASPRSPAAPKPTGPDLGPQPGQGPEQPRER